MLRASVRGAAGSGADAGAAASSGRLTRDHDAGLAVRRQAAADAATDPTERDKYATEAAESAALAETLMVRVGELEQLEHDRGVWLAHTAAERAAAERATVELAHRKALTDTPEPLVTAAEWLEAHRQVVTEDERHWEITDADLPDQHTEHAGKADQYGPAVRAEQSDRAERTDHVTRRENGGSHVHNGDGSADAAEDVREREADRAASGRPVEGDDDTRPEAATLHGRPTTPEVMWAPEDLRQIAEIEPEPVDEHTVRVPGDEEIRASQARAARALEEIAARQIADADREARDQAARLARWHTDDHTDDHHDDHTDDIRISTNRHN